MEDSTRCKLEAVNSAFRSSVLIGTVDILSDTDLIVVDMIEECNGSIIEDRKDVVGYPLSKPFREIFLIER